MYIDLGSNFACVQGRKFFEPELYEGGKILPFFDEFFGINRTSKEFCVLGFEGNAQHTWNLQRVERCYQRKVNFITRNNQFMSILFMEASAKKL